MTVRIENPFKKPFIDSQNNEVNSNDFVFFFQIVNSFQIDVSNRGMTNC